MKWHLKKVVSYVLLASSAWASSCYAQSAWAQSGYCQQPATCCAPCPNVVFHADFLYWKAHGSNIVIDSELRQKANVFTENLVGFTEARQVARQVQTFVVGTSDAVATKKKSLDFDWDPGFRFGFTIQKPCSCWAGMFDWTHLNTHASGKESPCDTKKCGKSFPKTYEIDADWTLHLDFYDFVLAKSSCWSSCLTVTPFIGVRLSRIHQRYSSEAEALFLGTFSDGKQLTSFVNALQTEITSIATVKEKHKFNGAGPRLGVNLDYCLGCGLSFLGTAAINGNVGYTDHRVQDCLEREVEGSGLSFVVKNIHQRQFDLGAGLDRIFEREQSLQANRWIADFGIGFLWNAMCNSCCDISIKLAWEYHAIFGQKHAYFGQDFEVPFVNVEGVTILPSPASRQFETAGRESPQFTGSCRSTLGLQGLVLSAIIKF